MPGNSKADTLLVSLSSSYCFSALILVRLKLNLVVHRDRFILCPIIIFRNLDRITDQKIQYLR